MLRKPRLLVLDEATNAIDIEGEDAFFERLLRVEPRLTIVIIAHRLESLRHCHRVLVFEKGRVVSDGSASASFSFRAINENYRLHSTGLSEVPT
jgi:ATP-binding cassette subfamily C protein